MGDSAKEWGRNSANIIDLRTSSKGLSNPGMGVGARWGRLNWISAVGNRGRRSVDFRGNQERIELRHSLDSVAKNDAIGALTSRISIEIGIRPPGMDSFTV